MRPTMRKLSSALLLSAIAAGSAAAQERLGIVTAVAAGDRVVFRTPDTQMEVMLAQIDAPAPGQASGIAARESLRDLCYGKVATLMESGTAPDGSTVGKLSCAGVRADEAQVRRGFAWVKPPFGELNSILRSAEYEARAHERGIWARSG